MGVVILFVLISLYFSEASELCTDTSPYCSTNDCTVRPGYALKFCKKTCGGCKPFCHNSRFVPCNVDRKAECDSMLKDYCPLLCGVCRENKKTSENKSETQQTLSITENSLLTNAVMKSLPMKSSGKEITKEKMHVPVIPSPTNYSLLFEQKKAESSYVIPPLRPHIINEDHDSTFELPILTSVASNHTDFISSERNSHWINHHPRNLNQKSQNVMIELPEPVPLILYPSQNSFKSLQPIWNTEFSNYDDFTNQPRSSFLSPFVLLNSRSSINNHVSNGFHRRPNLQNEPHPLGDFHRIASAQYLNSRHLNPLAETSNLNLLGNFQEVNTKRKIEAESPRKLAGLVSLLGCHDRDLLTCSMITDETCYSRPGFYLKMCPVRCKNCNGLQCIDSIKVNCDEVKKFGGCKLPTAHEYCPRTCRLCLPLRELADSIPDCKDELETCEHLSRSGVCNHPHSKHILRMYCAKSCGFCQEAQYYSHEVQNLSKNTSKSRQ